MSMTNGHENSLFNLLVSSKAHREIVSVHRDLPIRQALEPLLKKWGLNSNKVMIQLRYYQHTLAAETLAGDAEGTEIYVWKQSDPGDKDLKGFHPFINKASLKNCTQPYIGKDGWYLARESSSANGQFSLAVTFENQLRHFKINFSPDDGMYKVASKGFENLHELFAYYTIHSIKKTAGGDIFLSHPIPQEGKPENNPPAPKPENNPPPPPPPKHEKKSLSSIQSLPVERDLSSNNAHSNRPLPPLPGAPSHPQANKKPPFQPKVAPVHKPENIQPIQDHLINRTPVAATKPSAVNIFKNRKNSSTLPRAGRKASVERPLPPIPPPDEGPGMSLPNSLTSPLINPTPQIPSIKEKKAAIASKLFPQPIITKNNPKNRSYNDLNKPSSPDQSSEKQSNHAYPSKSPSSPYPTPQLLHANSNSSNSSNNEKEVPEVPPPLLPKGPTTPSNPKNTHSNSSNSSYYPSDPKQESQQAMNGSSTPLVSHANDPPSDDNLPPNWVRVYSNTRAKFYYFNQVSSETKWSHPLHGKEAIKQSNGLMDTGRSIPPSEAGQLMRGRSFSEAKKPKRQSPPLLNQKPSPVEKRCDKIQNRNSDFQNSSRLGYSPEPSSPIEKTRNRTQSFRLKEDNAHVYDHLPGSESQPPPASNNVQPRQSMQHNRQAPPIPVLSSPPATISNGLPAPNSKQQQPSKHIPQTQNFPSKHSAPVNSVPFASVPRGKPDKVGQHTIPAPPPNIPNTVPTRAASLPSDCTNPKQVGKSTTHPPNIPNTVPTRAASLPSDCANPKQVGKSTTLPPNMRGNLLDQIKNPPKSLRPVSDSEHIPKNPTRSSGAIEIAILNVLEKRKQMIQDSDESDFESADDEWDSNH